MATAYRVVALQKILQGVSDPVPRDTCGRTTATSTLRQFHDMKGSIELEGLDVGTFSAYVAACASLLARAHAQSPAAIEIVGYIGKSDAAAEAITRWSYAYADQSLRDFKKLRAAADEGRVPLADIAGPTD